MINKLSSNRQRVDGKQAVAIIAAVVLLISLIPILITGFYAHPSYDDYTYGISVHHVVEQGGSPIDVIKAAASSASSSYKTWQGTFSACFIFSLQPGVFSDDIYYLTPFILIGGLVLCTFCLFYNIVTKMLKGKISDVIILSSFVLFIQIQFVHDKSQAFYWFNGASYYTLYYSFAELFFALVIRLLFDDKGKYIHLALLMILAIIIGGGNYTTALFTSILLTFIVIQSAINKRKETVFLVFVWCVFCIAFVISMIAPGNSVRAGRLVGQSAGMAVLKSIYKGMKLCIQWLPFKGLPLVLLTLPIVYNLASRSNYTFKYPLLALGFAYGLFCAQLTPPLYAMSNIGAGRQVNIYYYSYFLLLLFSMYYCLGWLCHRKTEIVNRVVNNRIDRKRICLICVLVAMVCFSIKVPNSTTYVTTKSLMDGSTHRYDRDMEMIINKLEEQSEICVVDDVQELPVFFKYIGLEPNNIDWMAPALAKYFHHEEVRTH